jgi:hypothetical protein
MNPKEEAEKGPARPIYRYNRSSLPLTAVFERFTVLPAFVLDPPATVMLGL